jgi:hypothetical protein
MELKAALVDLGHKSAFDLLSKEAWNPEQAVMGNSTLPIVCDKLNINDISPRIDSVRILKPLLEHVGWRYTPHHQWYLDLVTHSRLAALLTAGPEISNGT